MLGDLVMFEGETFKIDGISIGEAHFGGDEEQIWCNEDNIEPIPLTAEILETNLIHFQYGYPWYQRERYRHPDEFNIHIDNVTEVYVKYVHELQHALRLCGLNEIADSFKI